MVENARRMLLLVAFVVIGSVLLLVLPERPIKLGLDLAGGVRLVYKLDFEQAYKDGSLSRDMKPETVIDETIAIIRGRVDPDGVRNPTIRKMGTDRIEISLPRSVQVSGRIAHSTCAEEVAGEDDPKTLDPIKLSGTAAEYETFPGAGGVIEIGREKIRYSSRVDNKLMVDSRGEAGTKIEKHAASSTIVLVSDDQIERLITELGDMRFYIGATETSFTAANKNLATERQKVVDWLKKPENAKVSLERFNSLTEEQGGPPTGFHWYSHRKPEGSADVPRESTLTPVEVPPPEWTFTGSHLMSVGKSQDTFGFPAVSFQMKAEKVGPFGDFTGSHVREPMVIVLNDEIVSYATINEKLPGQAQISGRFTDTQVDSMVKVLRSGSLQIKPILQQREDVGATVGQKYQDQGWIMGVTALGVIVAFMCSYYHWLGVYASIGLIINLLMQMGALVAFQAILTMPGIAGIILGIGMAVDANILIFDRTREEQEHGKKPLQAAKAGFSHAMRAIVDSNVSTVMAGLILYFIGTGPIRGFAVTLIIGVLTSFFAAVVVVRLLVHWHIERRPNELFKMKRWLADADFDIIGKTKIAITATVLLMVAGISLFFWLPDQRKLGIDFLGGATLKVRTEVAQVDEDLRAKVQAIGGQFASAEVAGLPDSRVGPGKFTEFRITFKTDVKAGSAQKGVGAETVFRQSIKEALKDVLQKDQLEVVQTQAADKSAVTGDLYFESAHPLSDIKSHLETAQLQGVNQFTDVKVDFREPGRENTFKFSASAPPGIPDGDLESMVKTAFVGSTDSTGKELRFAEQIPEASVIGGQVVLELRDSAIQALLFSMFMSVIYIRVRFSEYSYGFAAVASLLHDLVFVLGAISILIATRLIHTEFDMNSIAVFLSVMGYSMHDTIIVFDRVRENRPRMKGTLEEIVNHSINQTFSRTILTSGTAAATIFIVFLFNIGTGNALEGFSFAMFFGIATGTFSSIYIASPIFIFLEKRQIKKDDEERKREELQARNPGSKVPAV
jgi:protein-export membrane protein SecD/preprotein translocase SecF subunit